MRYFFYCHSRGILLAAGLSLIFLIVKLSGAPGFQNWHGVFMPMYILAGAIVLTGIAALFDR